MLIIRIIILLVFCVIATYTDLKTGEIPNWLTFGLISIGIIFNLIFYPIITFIFILSIMLGVYLLGRMLYNYMGFGGGDVKLYIGVASILPFMNDHIIILWVLLLSSGLALIHSIILPKRVIFKFAPYILVGVILTLVKFLWL